jgi:addiction module HigA family antidote
MKEYELNPFSLSKHIGLSPSAVRQITIGKSGISVPTALRLAKFFGLCASFWLDLQLQADMQAAASDTELQNALKDITKVKKPAAPAKGKPQGKNTKKNTLAEKRKKANKVTTNVKASLRKKPVAKKKEENSICRSKTIIHANVLLPVIATAIAVRVRSIIAKLVQEHIAKKMV